MDNLQHSYEILRTNATKVIRLESPHAKNLAIVASASLFVFVVTFGLLNRSQGYGHWSVDRDPKSGLPYENFTGIAVTGSINSFFALDSSYRLHLECDAYGSLVYEQDELGHSPNVALSLTVASLTLSFPSRMYFKL
jgi:hypothetical protein